MKACLAATTALTLSVATVSFAQEADPHAGHVMPPAPAEADAHAGHVMAPAPVEADPHAGHVMPPATADHAGHAMPATGIFGAYPMGRDASGTSWQPDASVHGGVHGARGGWSLMGHAVINGVYDYQGGLRGDEKAFVAGMLMGAARRDFGDGTLNFRAMLSPDPFMGKRGYPLLFAAGETADGVTPLVDRQHPHDLFMELSAAYSHRVGPSDSVFVYLGLPGEPAFGPPAFMHRQSIMASPEAPIAHHWLDSTHITFGVATAGWVHGKWKIEGSRFTGREPDENRYGIDSPKFDSTSARLSWNPTPSWALQASWAKLIGPEQLAPNEDEKRWSASAIYTVALGSETWWSTTVAWGRKARSHHEPTDVLSLESAVKPTPGLTLFARAETVETDELHSHAPARPGHIVHGDLETVAKVSIGLIQDWRVARYAKFGVGAIYTVNKVPALFEHDYGGSLPRGAMAFVRLVIE
jgi:hypothetical protein